MGVIRQVGMTPKVVQCAQIVYYAGLQRPLSLALGFLQLENRVYHVRMANNRVALK